MNSIKPGTARRLGLRDPRRPEARWARYPRRWVIGIGDDPRFAQGGWIPPAQPIPMTLDPDECVIAERDGIYRCVRPDHRHPDRG